MTTAALGPSEAATAPPPRAGAPSGHSLLVSGATGADALALESALAQVDPTARRVTPNELGEALWSPTGMRVLIGHGEAGVLALVPWLPIIRFTANTATLVVVDAPRGEVLSLLDSFDMWLAGRTAPALVAQQVVALWALLERQARLTGPRQIKGINLVIDLGREEVTDAEGTRIALTPSEFRLLAAMAVQPGRVVGFGQLGAALPGRFRDADDAYNSVKVHVGRLRQKLHPATGWDGHIVSVRGRGFLFERRLLPERNGDQQGSEVGGDQGPGMATAQAR